MTVTDPLNNGHTVPGPWRSIEEIKRANRRIDHHFFDADTMRFFLSRLAPGIIAGRFFVTSEQFVSFDGAAIEPRRYTVRQVTDEGEISDASEFQRFPTLRAARRWADQVVKGEVEG